MPVIRYTNTIKSIWEKYLRVIFSSDTTPAEYRYNANEKLSKIRIYKEQPMRVYNLPMITISSGSGDASLRYLGNEVVKDVYNLYNECVLNSTLKYTPIKNSVVGVFGINPINGQKTVYVVNTDFSVDWNKGKFIWDKGVSEPQLYYATYATFESISSNNTVYNEYKERSPLVRLVSFSATNPTGIFSNGDKYYNTTDHKIYTYNNKQWIIPGEYPELGTLYLDTSNEYLFEYTLSGMTRVYTESTYPRLYLDYYEPVYEGFLVYSNTVVNGYVLGEQEYDYQPTAWLEYRSSQILEVYTYDSNGTKVYYNRDEAYCTLGTNELHWNITAPEFYFVSYIAAQNILSFSGKFVQSPLNVEVRFDVFARSSQDRERITDLLVLYLRHIIKDSVAPYFVYSRETVSGETQEQFDNQSIYKNSITVPCVTHYSNYIDNSAYALIKSIKLDTEVE